ncbi:unnamed protein product [Prorocentrum cordatum]|uniref:Uncharacterized protein n=1 Tax=Prorocentrum cordatum TaxID=2364126 RepID=A0ABN9VZB3_9DINO|nr:unnamed protein product [Polarella glacialis]
MPQDVVDEAKAKALPPARAPWCHPLRSSLASRGSGPSSGRAEGTPPAAKPRLTGLPPPRGAVAAAEVGDVAMEGEGEEDGDRRRKPKRRGGRRARQGEHQVKTWSSKGKDLLALLQATLKLVLLTAHKNRLACTVSIHTYTMPTNHEMVINITEELEGYNGLLVFFARRGPRARRG